MKALSAVVGGVLCLAAGLALGTGSSGISTFGYKTLAAVGLTPPPAVPPEAADKAVKPAAAPQGETTEHSATGITMPADLVTSQDIALVKVGGGTLARHILVPGTVTTDTDRVARAPARVVGTVEEMRKRLGDPVQKGEVIAVLDSREVADAKSEYLTARVQDDLQKITFERQKNLLKSDATSKAAFDQARTTYLGSQLRMDLARQKLSALGLDAQEVAATAKRDEATPNRSSLRTYPIKAPLSGRIVERKVDVGTKVGAEGDPAELYTIADLSSLWIELAVPTTDLERIKEGASVNITAGANDAPLQGEGKVVFVSPLLNADTRSARVVVALPNAHQRWRPGTFVTAEVEIARDTVPVLVPRKAIQTIGGERVVFVRTTSGFDGRKVQIGRSDDTAMEVTGGLAPGEEIAVANTFLLKAEFGKAEAAHDD